MSSNAPRVLITGGSGFIGTNLMEHYLARGSAVLNLDIVPPRNSEQKGLWQNVSILDSNSLNAAFKEFRPEIVMHMGARTDLGGKNVGDYAANVEGVANVIVAVNECPSVLRAIYASSRLVFEIGHEPSHDYDYKPSTYYGESKVKGEELVKSQDSGAVPWVLVRPTSIWGPWFDVPYRDFFLHIANNRYVHPTGHSIRKSFGFVGNAVHELSVLAETISADCLSRVFFIADYEPVNVSEWGTLIQERIGSNPIRQIPLGLMRGLAYSGDMLKMLGMRNPPLTSFRLNNLLTPMVYDLSPLEKIVGNLPFSAQIGVETTVSWLESVGLVNGETLLE